jgi:hypothetical protein
MGRVVINNSDTGAAVRAALNAMTGEIYAGKIFPTVTTFADLPAAATVADATYRVATTTGIFLISRRSKGLYTSDGANWIYNGDFPVTAADLAFVPAGGVGAVNLQAAVEELDTEKASKAAVDPLTLTATPTAPATGTIVVGETSLGGLEVMSIRAPGWTAYVPQFLTGRQRTVGVLYTVGSATPGFMAGTAANFATLGTATAVTPTATSHFTRQFRISYVSATTAGSLAGHCVNSSSARNFTVGGSGVGGFLFIARFGQGDAATVAGARQFVGLSIATATPTNVEPSTELNQIGFGQISTSNNMHVIFGGSVAQTPIDLGASFPMDTLSVDSYECVLFSDKNDNTKIRYQVTRLNTGDVATGTLTNTTPGTTLPATTAFLGKRAWRCNNATLAAVTLALHSVVVHVDL